MVKEPRLSIVSTIYKSEKTIIEFLNRMSKSVLNTFGDDYEIIIVNDGSPDNSLNLALEESKKLKKIKIVDLSRNFGHHKAIMSGLAYASGELVFLIDSDLEEMPEIFEDFIKEFKKNSADVIYGVQRKRKGSLFERISGKLYFKLFNLITNLNYPENVLTARLMKRKYVDSLLLHKESELYLIGIWHLTGFRQIPIPITKKSLTPTTYTLAKKLSLVVNSIVSFSNRPLKYIFYLGILITTLVISYSSKLLFSSIFLGISVSGWTSLILSIWFFGGLTTMILGILGIYLSKIFIETKHRPFLIVKDTYFDGFKNDYKAKINMNRY